MNKYSVLIVGAILAILTISGPRARAQTPVVVVGDVVATANQVENMAKWVESIADLNQQINQLQQSINIATTVKNYIGDPSAAAGAVNLNLLGSNSLGQTVGQLTSQLNQAANGLQALQNNGQGLFTSVPSQTPSGFSMSYQSDTFKPYSAIQNQSQNAGNVASDTTSRVQQLEQDKAQTLAELTAATTETEVQKLQAKLNAIDGEIAALGRQQALAHEQLVDQDVANRNDQEMQAKAANAAADHEMSVSLQNYAQWQGQITSTRTPFQ